MLAEQMPLTHDLEYHPFLLTGTSGIENGADGIDRAAVFTDDFTNVFLGYRKFDDCGIAASSLGYEDLVRLINQSFDYVLDQRFH